MIREPRNEFVGRRHELETLARLLGSSRLVTLTGVGGAGKTRLAIRAANERSASADLACWFVPLEALEDPHRLPMAVLRALPVSGQAARDPIELITHELSRTPTVLVLDNCEHLIDAAAGFVDELLNAVPGLTVIATSRRPLELDGERVFAVPPLSTSAQGTATLADAVALLEARARAANATFALTPDEIATAVELCRALDGLPLAIELAATLLRTLSLDELLQRLSSRFTLLRGGPRNAVARQRTLRAVVDWSYELCTERAREVWSALSVFAGSFDLAAAIAVADGDEREVVDTMDQLVLQSIVEADRESGRFRMLETIKRYGRERAEEAGHIPLLARRHLGHYQRLAAQSRIGWYGPGQVARLATLRADRAELQAALATATATVTDVDAGLALFSDLRYHWAVGGFLPEGRGWATRVLALPGGAAASRISALLTSGWLALLQGDLGAAAALLDEAAALANGEPADARTEWELHRWRGTHALFSGDPDRARQEFTASIAVAQAYGEPGEALLAQFLLTTALAHLRAPHAADAATAALATAEATGEMWMRSHALWSLAFAAFVDGQLDAAERLAIEAISAERGFDDPVGSCLMLEVLSWTNAERGPNERSAILLGAADAQWRRIGSAITVYGPQMSAHHDRCVALLRDRLGARTYERLSLAGAQLDPAEAVTLALEPPAGSTGLSARELEVAMRIHLGSRNREIAEDLVLSVRTVDTHVQRILVKLGFTSRAQIAVWYEATIVDLAIT
ncbi:MAG: LuxR C-terminal-related transcriptional regulator [Pseudolysinimonas sp.]